MRTGRPVIARRPPAGREPMSSRSSTLRAAYLVAVGAILSACGPLARTPTPASTEPIPFDFQVTLERGPCFGSCPVYTLTVRADGAVEFEGWSFVAAEGSRTALLDAATVRRLRDAVIDSAFYQLVDRYEVQATDPPSITTTVKMNGQTKSVYHYGLGCGTDLDEAPEGLCRLEGMLEGIPQANGWVSTP